MFVSGKNRHVKAAQLAVGIDCKRVCWQLDLTQLHRNKRKRPDRTYGRKRPRADELEVVREGDVDEDDVATLVSVLQGQPDVELDNASVYSCSKRS